MAHPDFEQSLIALMPNLYRFGLRLSRRPDLAEDLVQTTVERALAARDSLAPEMQLEPWVFRILRNAWIDLTRRARTRGTEIDIDDAPEAAIVDGPRVMEAALLLDATERALDSLSPDQREVLLLVCYQEMSYAETAEILGIPLWAAAAAASLALAVGLGGGLMLGGGGQPQDGSSAMALAAAFDRVPSGEMTTLADGTRLSPVLSFHGAQGAFCREYKLGPSGAQTLEMACDAGAGWETQLMLALTEGEGYAPAAAPELLRYARILVTPDQAAA